MNQLNRAPIRDTCHFRKELMGKTGEEFQELLDKYKEKYTVSF